MLLKTDRCRVRRVRGLGFTLVELLVVISIVALLAAILSPSLTSAREQAKQVVCAGRLRQWGVAFNCYAAESAGMWPHCDGLDRGPKALTDPYITPEDLADWHGWMDVLPPLLDLKPWRDYPRYQRPDNTTFYQCPSGRLLEADGLYSYRPRRDGYFSYAMNSCLELDKNAWPPPGRVGYPMPSFLDSGRIVRPERVYLLFDHLLDPRKGFDAKAVYRGAGKYSGSYPKAFADRHRHGLSDLGGNILFCEGHVDWRKSVWKPEWDAAQEVPPRDDPNWYPYPVPGYVASSSRNRAGAPGSDP
ncbi:MAG: prepilin-type N-terminal cleavage/methylation domain-containing protein [Planctomycetota bacterium]